MWCGYTSFYRSEDVVLRAANTIYEEKNTPKVAAIRVLLQKHPRKEMDLYKESSRSMGASHYISQAPFPLQPQHKQVADSLDQCSQQVADSWDKRSHEVADSVDQRSQQVVDSSVQRKGVAGRSLTKSQKAHRSTNGLVSHSCGHELELQTNISSGGSRRNHSSANGRGNDSNSTRVGNCISAITQELSPRIIPCVTIRSYSAQIAPVVH